MKLTPEEVLYIVNESVKGIINSGNLFQDNKLEGNPQSLKDVFYSDGWTAKSFGGGVFQCFHNSNDFRTREYLPFEELVEDINIYFEDNNLPYVARAIDAPNGEDRGEFIKFFKRR